MVISSFHDLDRKAKRLYKSHNPLNVELAYSICRQGILGLDTIHLIGTTRSRTGEIITNMVGSRRLNILGQPFTAAIKCTGADMATLFGLKLTSFSLKAKNSIAPTEDSVIHLNSCISMGSNGTKFTGATILQLFTHPSHSSSWCIGGKFSFRSKLKSIVSLSYLSPNFNMVTRAFYYNLNSEITSSFSYRFSDKLKSGLSVLMVENNDPLLGLGVKYRFSEAFCLTAKVDDLGRTAFGFKYSPGPNFTFALSLAP